MDFCQHQQAIFWTIGKCSKKENSTKIPKEEIYLESTLLLLSNIFADTSQGSKDFFALGIRRGRGGGGGRFPFTILACKQIPYSCMLCSSRYTWCIYCVKFLATGGVDCDFGGAASGFSWIISGRTHCFLEASFYDDIVHFVNRNQQRRLYSRLSLLYTIFTGENGYR